jgi:hypothetical protein
MDVERDRTLAKEVLETGDVLQEVDRKIEGRVVL